MRGNGVMWKLLTYFSDSELCIILLYDVITCFNIHLIQIRSFKCFVVVYCCNIKCPDSIKGRARRVSGATSRAI